MGKEERLNRRINRAQNKVDKWKSRIKGSDTYKAMEWTDENGDIQTQDWNLNRANRRLNRWQNRLGALQQSTGTPNITPKISVQDALAALQARFNDWNARMDTIADTYEFDEEGNPVEVASPQRTVFSNNAVPTFGGQFASSRKVNNTFTATPPNGESYTPLNFERNGKMYSTKTWEDFALRGLTMDQLQALASKEDWAEGDKAFNDNPDVPIRLKFAGDDKGKGAYDLYAQKNAQGTYDVFDYGGASRLRGGAYKESADDKPGVSGWDYDSFLSDITNGDLSFDDIVKGKGLKRKTAVKPTTPAARNGMRMNVRQRFFNGGLVKYYQAGGTVDPQQQFVSDLAEVTGAKSQEELELVLQGIGPNVQQLFQGWAQAEHQQPGAGKQYIALALLELMSQQAPMGRNGLRFAEMQGYCPEGYEVEKYLVGGCVKCREGKQLMLQKEIASKKCGGKTKKRF